MRSVRRGLVAAALAFPLALGFAGVAGAAEKGEGSVDWASYEASFAAAGPEGAAAGEVASEALHAEFEKNGDDKDRDKDKDKDKENGHNGDNGDNGEKEVSYAEFEASGAAAGFKGAIAGEIEASALHVEKG
ncbi:hypothetical protein [Saccharomonospora cyanea]|uniref:Uncharacterized protein n=1 Tax=Saccharomonospora cyanea NA-134 TaxID=882082 RepID=H5XRD0_9PSEU|nr:hypothetical protein [Saccharomonospora cyanea]EHR63412.1 hypothetical protein SaccyDRAFT_4604 [Saccharomonospora cyanea NA-134]